MTQGLARLYDQAQVRGTDRLMRVVYNLLAPLHDPAVAHLVPLLGFGDEDLLRDGFMRRVDLRSLSAPTDGRPVRVLEVGVGTGANLALVERDLPAGLDVDLWGVDLSIGMLRGCRQRLARRPLKHGVRLLVADAHALPFLDNTFDRVFHMGGIGGYRDARRALAEMARIAKPGTPIVIFDEQLDPAQPLGLLQHVAFRVSTFYDRNPHCPREMLPPDATNVAEDQLSKAFYCLTFSKRPTGEPPNAG